MKAIHLLLPLLLSTFAQANSVTYFVSLNTSSLNGTQGFLDFQFNPGPPLYDSAQLTLSNFNFGGGAPDLNVSLAQGTVLGDPLTSLVFDNCCAAANEYAALMNFGASISFQADLTWTSGQIPPDSPTSFYFSVFNAFFQPVLTSLSDPFTQVIQFDLNPDGSTIASGFAGEAYIGQSPFSAVPEPATIALLLSALACAFLKTRH